MSPIRHAVALTALLTAGAAGIGTAQTNTEFTRAWRSVAESYRQLVHDEGVVGSSLWFVHDGEVLAREYDGSADLESGREVDEHTIYHWASITKTFTGIAIMQLRDRGRLHLDDPIVDYVPELQDAHNPYGSMRDITIRHLLEHSAGFRGSTWPWGGNEEWHPHEPTEWSQLVSMMPYTNILFPPGSRYSYSNPGIIFLGRVIERLSGDPFEAYIDKNIFKPLEMYRSYFDHTPYHLLAHRSNNYFVTAGEVRADGLDFNTGITVSNGGLNAPVGDMVRYLTFLTGHPDRQDRYDAILARASLEEMWQIAHPIENSDDIQHSIALTYFILERNGRRYVGHTGGQKAFVSFFYVHPETRTAAIAAFNSLGLPGPNGEPAHPDTRAILARVRAQLFDEIFPLFDSPRSAGR